MGLTRERKRKSCRSRSSKTLRFVRKSVELVLLLDVIVAVIVLDETCI